MEAAVLKKTLKIFSLNLLIASINVFRQTGDEQTYKYKNK